MYSEKTRSKRWAKEMNNQYPRCRFPDPKSVRISITTVLRSLLLTSISTVGFFRWICCYLLLSTFFPCFLSLCLNVGYCFDHNWPLSLSPTVYPRIQGLVHVDFVSKRHQGEMKEREIEEKEEKGRKKRKEGVVIFCRLSLSLSLSVLCFPSTSIVIHTQSCR